MPSQGRPKGFFFGRAPGAVLISSNVAETAPSRKNGGNGKNGSKLGEFFGVLWENGGNIALNAQHTCFCGFWGGAVVSNMSDAKWGKIGKLGKNIGKMSPNACNFTSYQRV